MGCGIHGALGSGPGQDGQVALRPQRSLRPNVRATEIDNSPSHAVDPLVRLGRPTKHGNKKWLRCRKLAAGRCPHRGGAGSLLGISPILRLRAHEGQPRKRPLRQKSYWAPLPFRRIPIGKVTPIPAQRATQIGRPPHEKKGEGDHRGQKQRGPQKWNVTPLSRRKPQVCLYLAPRATFNLPPF